MSALPFHIVFLNADGAEVPPGSSEAVTVRAEGFELLRNGDFRIVSTWTHPSPPPPEQRRCRTRGGKLPPANPRPAASSDDHEIAVLDAERIEPSRDPPENLAPRFTLLDLKNEPDDLPEIAASRSRAAMIHAAVHSYLRQGWSCVLDSLDPAPDSLFFEHNTAHHYRVRLATPEEFSELEKRLGPAPNDQLVFVAVKKKGPFLIRRVFTATGNPKENEEAAKGLYELSDGEL